MYIHTHSLAFIPLALICFWFNTRISPSVLALAPFLENVSVELQYFVTAFVFLEKTGDGCDTSKGIRRFARHGKAYHLMIWYRFLNLTSFGKNDMYNINACKYVVSHQLHVALALKLSSEGLWSIRFPCWTSRFSKIERYQPCKSQASSTNQKNHI